MEHDRPSLRLRGEPGSAAVHQGTARRRHRPDEPTQEAARRELAEETGIVLDQLGPCLWVRETRFRYRGHHHRREPAYLGYTRQTAPRLRLKHTASEQQGMLGYQWWTDPGLARCPDKLLPPSLPQLLAGLLHGRWHGTLELDR